MKLPAISFNELIRDMSMAVTSSASTLIDVSVGSVLRAIIEANAALALWIQWLTMLMLQTTRAATSVGPDLDTWMADFGLDRKSANEARGNVTVARFNATSRSFIYPGALFKTGDGRRSYVVVRNASHAAWQEENSAYLMVSGLFSIDIPVIASRPGSDGNVVSNSVSIIASPMAGIDTVINLNPFVGGRDSETDENFRVRFGGFFSSRSRATSGAIEFAISQTKEDIRYKITENSDAVGNFKAGSVLVIVDDRTGQIRSDFFDAIASEVTKVRAAGISVILQPPAVENLAITVCLNISSPQPDNVLTNLISDNIQEYLHSLRIGGVVSITHIACSIYRTNSNILNVSRLKINGHGDDIQLGKFAIAQFREITIDQVEL